MTKKWSWVPFLPKRWKKKRSQWVNKNLAGIRGWLILPAIGCVFTLIFGPIKLLLINYQFYNYLLNHSITGFEIFTWFEISSFIIFKCFAAVLFFMKKRFAPKAIIITHVIVFSFSCVSLIFANNDDKAFFIPHVVESFIWSCIWIPYFLMSERVKATFVN